MLGLALGGVGAYMLLGVVLMSVLVSRSPWYYFDSMKERLLLFVPVSAFWPLILHWKIQERIMLEMDRMSWRKSGSGPGFLVYQRHKWLFVKG